MANLLSGQDKIPIQLCRDETAKDFFLSPLYFRQTPFAKIFSAFHFPPTPISCHKTPSGFLQPYFALRKNADFDKKVQNMVKPFPTRRFCFTALYSGMEASICNPVGLMMQIGFKSGNSDTKCLLIGKSMRRRSFVLWYGVVTAAAPRMTANYAFYGKQASFECSVFFYRFQGVLRTGGCKSASGRSMW